MASLIPVIATGKYISTVIGKEVVIKAITDTSSNVYSQLTSIISNNNHGINKLLEEMDIDAKLKTLEALISEIEKTEKYKQESVHLSLNFIHQSISKIHKNLEKLDKEIKYHDSKWFSSYRSAEYKPTLDCIISDYIILEKRVDFLIKVIQIK